MRGSPFAFSNFSMGLNALDSPYELKTGEARDVLNMQSTLRGAIRKRTGSIQFAGGIISAFPILGVTDSFERANENPLSNGGKWKPFREGVAQGEIKSNHWQPEPGIDAGGDYWSVGEQNNPAVSVKITQTSRLGETAGTSSAINLYVMKNAGDPFAETNTHYRVRYIPNSQDVITLLVKQPESLSITKAAVKYHISDAGSLGMTVRSNKISVWAKKSNVAEWEKIIEYTDTTFTKGWIAFEGKQVPGTELSLNNFSIGETPAPAELAKCTSIGRVDLPGRYLLVTAGKNLYSITPSAEVSIIKEGLTENTRWSMFQATSGAPNRVVADGPVYLSNGVDPPLYWTAASKTTEAKTWTGKVEGEFVEVPKAKYLLYHNSRIWAAGMEETGSAVRFSGLAERSGEGFQVDPTSWPKPNIMQFEQADGTEITGLGTSGIYVLVFKPHAIWAVFSTATEEGEGVRQVSENVGCISHRSIVETEGGTYFLTPDKGVYMTNGVSVREISQQVRPILQGTDYRESRAANVSKLETAAAGFLNGHYYLSYDAQDGSRKTLDYDILLKSWWLHDIAGEQWVVWGTTTNESSLFTIPAEAKKGVYKTFVKGIYTDGGENYKGGRGLSCYWISSWEPFWQYFMRHRFQQPQVKKRVHQLFVDGRGELKSFLFTAFGKEATELKGTIDNADMAKPEALLTLSDNTEEPEPEYKAARYYSLGSHRIFSVMFGNASGNRLEITAYAMNLSFRKS